MMTNAKKQIVDNEETQDNILCPHGKRTERGLFRVGDDCFECFDHCGLVCTAFLLSIKLDMLVADMYLSHQNKEYKEEVLETLLHLQEQLKKRIEKMKTSKRNVQLMKLPNGCGSVFGDTHPFEINIGERLLAEIEEKIKLYQK
jgi:glutaredoxin